MDLQFRERMEAPLADQARMRHTRENKMTMSCLRVTWSPMMMLIAMMQTMFYFPYFNMAMRRTQQSLQSY